MIIDNTLSVLRFHSCRIRKIIALALAAALFTLGHGRIMTEVRNAPEAFFAESGEALLKKTDDRSSYENLSVCVSSSGSETLCDGYVKYKLFGLITLRSIPAHIGQRPQLIPGGEAVGISIHTEGVLVVGVETIISAEGRRSSPISNAGIQPGDVLISVNGVKVDTADKLKEAVNSSFGRLRIEYVRAGKHYYADVVPAEADDGTRKIGAWVRDSTVGIGTLSFCDEQTGIAAALGHAVIDADTGSMLTVKDGKLVSASIIGVTKGRQGSPGELHGTFDGSSQMLGSIVMNTDLGIYGELCREYFDSVSSGSFETAFPDEVRTGEAKLICSANGTKKEYSCRILKTGKQDSPEPKGLVIEITDSELIDLTGGIVQGMSGSPVIQDGRLVGVITHVFVNDPLKGYGAYAYWMYKRFGG